MLKNITLGLSSILVAMSAQAKSFSAGENILCERYEGKILELYQDNTAKVYFTSSYYENRLKPEGRTTVLNIDHCQKQLPEFSKITEKKIAVSDTVACGPWRGEVLSVYEGGNAKVKFTSSYYNDEKTEYVTNLLNVDHCEKRLFSETAIANDIKSGDMVMCNQWRGFVLEVFTGNKARVVFISDYSSGREKKVFVTSLLDVAHCQK